MSETTDGQLVAAYFKGDERALESLVGRYLKPVYGFVRRYLGSDADAEDVTQEVFLKVWKNLAKFDAARSFKTWIFSIAKNASVDFMRKRKDLAFTDFEDEDGGNPLVDSLEDPAPLPSELMERADSAALVQAAMARLPAKQRMVLYLRYNDHFTFNEIAESLGEPMNTVKSRHQRALAALRLILTGNDAPKGAPAPY